MWKDIIADKFLKLIFCFGESLLVYVRMVTFL
jgi:hypothetical protein